MSRHKVIHLSELGHENDPPVENPKQTSREKTTIEALWHHAKRGNKGAVDALRALTIEDMDIEWE